MPKNYSDKELAAIREPAQNSSIWGGVGLGQPSAPVTGVTASFTVPTLSGQSGALMSVWVGMNNFVTGGILQTGIYCAYNTGSTGNNSGDGLTPWTWWLAGTNSAGSEIWSPTAFPVKAGDSMTLAMTYSTYWSVTQTNSTRGWTYTENKSFQSVGNCVTDWVYPMTSAWVIIENEASSLPNYGSLKFTNVATTPAINSTYINYQTTVGAHTQQTCGTLTNGSFTMTWVAAS